MTEITGVDVEIDAKTTYPDLEDIVISPSIEEQTLKSSKYGYNNIKVKGIECEELEITPSYENQVQNGMFNKVTVNKIQSAELIVTPSTQEQIIEGLYDKVIVGAIEGASLNITPTEEPQNIEGVFGQISINPIQTEEVEPVINFSSSDTVEVKATDGSYIKKATISKDTNLLASNIKTGVSVYGIPGNVADTSDANAVENDIMIGKSAYVNNVKVRGAYIPLDTSDATATADDIAKGKTAYVNGEKVEGSLEVTNHNATLDSTGLESSCRVTTMIRKLGSFTINIQNATSMFIGCTNLVDVNGLDLGIATTMSDMFSDCTSLKEMPLFDTSKITNITRVCYRCTNLETIPLWNTQNLSNMGIYYSFYKCPNLSNQSLYNIMQMAINATKLSSNYRTLKEMGLSQDQATICTTLSNYQAFLDAGWTTGY